MNRKKNKLIFLLLTFFLLYNPSVILLATSKLLLPLDPYDMTHYKRSIKFAGYTFKVKDSSLSDTGRLGPNQNSFSDNEQSVTIDELGRLVLNLTQDNGVWQAAEVISTDDLGYGIYTFKIDSRIDQLDPNVMFSIFLYKDDENEIDIEFSNFEHYNSQFIIQPYTAKDHISTYITSLNGSYTSYMIDYQPDYVNFKAYHGHDLQNQSNLIHEWTYKDNPAPSPEGMNLRFNLYIHNTDHPLNNEPQQIIITDFSYYPSL